MTVGGSVTFHTRMAIHKRCLHGLNGCMSGGQTGLCDIMHMAMWCVPCDAEQTRELQSPIDNLDSAVSGTPMECLCHSGPSTDPYFAVMTSTNR